jgi:hypothetical protein
VPRFLGDEQDAVDLVDLDELDLDVLVMCRRDVLTDVVGPDGKLAVAAVDEDRKLDTRGPPVVEQGVDGGTDRASRVQDVVAQDAGHPLEREVETRRLDHGLRVERRASADVHVVPVKGDVEGAERDLVPGELVDQPPKAMRDRDAARVDADERRTLELGIPLDDLVGDSNERATKGLSVQQNLPRLHGRTQNRLLSGLTGPS